MFGPFKAARVFKEVLSWSMHIWTFSGILLYHSFTAGTSSRNQHAPSPDSHLNYFSFRSSCLYYIFKYIFLQIPCQLNLLLVIILDPTETILAPSPPQVPAQALRNAERVRKTPQGYPAQSDSATSFLHFFADFCNILYVISIFLKTLS